MVNKTTQIITINRRVESEKEVAFLFLRNNEREYCFEYSCFFLTSEEEATPFERSGKLSIYT